MNPRIENPLTIEEKAKAREFLPTYYQGLSDAFKRVRETLQVSGQDNHENCIKAAEATNLLASMENYIACAKLADLDTSSLNGALNKLKQIVNTTGEPIAGNMFQSIQKQIIDPVWNFNYDNVLIKQGLGNTTFPIQGLPKEMLNTIASYSGARPAIRLCLSNQPSHTLFQPNFDKLSVQELLHHIIYGDPVNAMKMLNSNPRLLRLAGDCVAPSGDCILGVTPYGCALGAGDDDMAAQIKACFSKIKGGVEEEAKQYATLKPFIDVMLTQQPSYDLSGLMTIFLKSSHADVTAALNCNTTHKSELWDALEAFRKHFAPRDIKEGMHFNYQDLQHAFDILQLEFNNLIQKIPYKDYEKIDLFARQVIGYIQRGLPACDRQAFAQGIVYIVDKGEKKQRSFKFRLSDASFPIFAGDDSFAGLGYKYYVDSYQDLGGATVGQRLVVRFPKLISSKNKKLAELMPPDSKPEATGRVIS